MPIFLKVFPSFLIVPMLLLGSQPAVALDQESNSASAANSTEGRQISSGELESEICFNVYAEQWTGDSLGSNEFERFQDVAGIFEKYGEQYGIDYLVSSSR